jgi:hypothetical protein
MIFLIIVIFTITAIIAGIITTILGLRQCVEIQNGMIIGNKFENKELLK